MKNICHSLAKNWLEQGFHKNFGGFAENMSTDLTFQGTVFRAMVQARQIYSVCVFQDMGLSSDTMKANALSAADLLMSKYQTDTGAVWNSISENHKVVDATHGLYAQAFALFGWAYAYKLSADTRYEAAALKLLQYLQNERMASAGGYYEIENGKELLLANPHMHLFEAALAWAEISENSRWKDLAESLYQLCRTKFIPKHDGMLAEYYSDNWEPLLENSRFIVEPGHQCEWAWLMGRYDRLIGKGDPDLKVDLFSKSEKCGLNCEGFLVDEVWSDGQVKNLRSRLWPQCERVKAASLLFEVSSDEKYARLANSGFERILSYIVEDEGIPLWREFYHGEGRYQYFEDQWVKASSLYHVMGAFSEYTRIFGFKEKV